jgi:D-alanyl-D-alanine dipeptidase
MSHEIPIPDLSDLREIKDQYRNYPIDTSNSLHDEELVPISEFGLKGQSYYSQPNKMTGEPLPDVNPEALLRYSVAEKLEAANRELRTSKDISKLLGGKVELVVRDALRSAELQQHLHDAVWPNVLKKAYPDWSDDKIQEELPHFISEPKDPETSPTPHMTGGAVDLNLLKQDGSLVDRGHISGTVVVQTDYHEGYSPKEYPANPNAKMARRVLYWTMRDQGFSNNPTEYWHYSWGDQMWALFNREPAALYGAVESAPDILKDD